MAESRFKKFKARVEKLLRSRYGITLNDCTDDERLVTAFHTGETSEDFVDQIASKYDLDRIDTGGW